MFSATLDREKKLENEKYTCNVFFNTYRTKTEHSSCERLGTAAWGWGWGALWLVVMGGAIIILLYFVFAQTVSKTSNNSELL